MNCDQARSLMYEEDRVDTDPDIVSKLSSHLKECEHCKNELENFKNLITLLKNLKKEDFDESFWERQFKEIRHTLNLLKAEKACHALMFTFRPYVPAISLISAFAIFLFGASFFIYKFFSPFVSSPKEKTEFMVLADLEGLNNINQDLHKISSEELNAIIKKLLHNDEVTEEILTSLSSNQIENLYDDLSDLDDEEMNIFLKQLDSYFSV